MDIEIVDHYIFKQYTVASLVTVVLVIIGDDFPNKEYVAENTLRQRNTLQSCKEYVAKNTLRH